MAAKLELPAGTRPYPASGNVLVREIPLDEEVTEGGIVLAEERDRASWSRRGKVIASEMPDWKEGMVVFYASFNAAQIDADHYFVHGDNVQGYLTGA